MRNNGWTQEEQTELIRMAAALEIAIATEHEELNRLAGEHFRRPPSAPQKNRVDMNVVVKPDYSAVPKFIFTFQQYLAETATNPIAKILGKRPIINAWLIGSVVASAGVVLRGPFTAIAYLLCIGIIVFAFKYRRKKLAEYELEKSRRQYQLVNSNAYIQAKAAAENNARAKQSAILEARRREQARYDAEYADSMRKYNNDIMPRYNAEKEKWTAAHNLKIEALRCDCKQNEAKLAGLYAESKIISSHYRNIEALVWIYNEMKDTGNDVQRALDLYIENLKLQQLGDMSSKIDYMHNDMMRGMQAVYMQLDAINSNTAMNNAILDDISETLRKTRRDMNIGNVVGTYQRYKFSKQFTEFAKKFS